MRETANSSPTNPIVALLSRDLIAPRFLRQAVAEARTAFRHGDHKGPRSTGAYYVPENDISPVPKP